MIRCIFLLPFPCMGLVELGHAAKPGPARVAVSVDGERFSARLVELKPGKQLVFRQLVFQQSDRQRTMKLNDLVLWGTFADRSDGSQLLLDDGSILAADVLAIEDETVVMAGRMWTETRLPLRAVRAIVFRTPLDSLARDQLYHRILFETRREDRLLLENGDQLPGRLVMPMRPEPGAFTPTIVSWRMHGQTPQIKVPVDRVIALVFRAAKPVTSASVAGRIVIGFRDGSRVYARHIERRADALAVELSESVRLTTEAALTTRASPWQDVTLLQPLGLQPLGLQPLGLQPLGLQPLGGQVTYLSDLTPIGYKHIPYLALQWPYHLDRSVAGGQLRHDGLVFTKGIGMHSSARLAYDIGDQYHWLEAELAIDQRADRHGSVMFRVYSQNTDGQWSLAYESPIVRGGQPRVPMRVDLSGTARIALIVDFADRADLWDHADWLNARLVK